jgi:hypothetical protein
MKPAQKLLLSCRQTSEGALRLADWLAHNRTLLGVGYDAIHEEVQTLAGQLVPLVRSCETRPTVGLLGTPGACKTDLLFAILGTRAPVTLAEFGARPLDIMTLRALLPSESEAGCSAIIRFSSADAPATPRGHPLRVGLLALADLAIILTSSAYALALCDENQSTFRDVDDLFTSLADHLSPQALPGLSETDVQDLRDALVARWPDHPHLTALSAAGYWDQFREVAPHLADRERRQALSLLWGQHADVTALFERLCEGLDRLANGSDAYCGMEALLGKDKASGWMSRHHRSIIDGATVLALETGTGHALSVVNRYGQSVEMDRAVLAALLSELPLHISGSRLSEIEPAEVLDFPSAAPIADRHLTLVSTARAAGMPDQAMSGLPAIIAHFLHAKTIYLVERACDRHDVTSLVVVADPARDDDTYTVSIGDWVERSQGATAHDRERVRRGLFIAIAEHLYVTSAGPSPRRTPVHGEHLAVQRLLRDVIGAGQDWPSMWTPNRPLSDVVVFSAPSAATTPTARPSGSNPHAAPHGQSQSAGPIASSRSVEPWTEGQSKFEATAIRSSMATVVFQGGSIPAVSTTTARHESDVSELVRALSVANDVREKHHQLGQSLQAIRRRLRNTVMRYHASNDPASVAAWRRSTAIVVQDRLERLSDEGRLAHLQRALLPVERDLATALAYADRAGSRSASGQRPASTTFQDPNGAPGNKFDLTKSVAAISIRWAECAVAAWFQGLHRLTRSPRLCRDLKIQSGVLQHLIDELQIGAMRVALTSEIASAFQRSCDATTAIKRNPSRPPSLELSNAGLTEGDRDRLAAFTCRFITSYLEVLDGVSHRVSSSTSRTTSSYDVKSQDASSQGTSVAGLRQRGGLARPKRLPATRWEASFVTLVESNITSAHLLVGRGDRDRELGELLQLFTPGPFEVQT